MSSYQFSDSIKEHLQDRKLIIVSNREPYLHKKSGSAIKVDKPAGGLTSAMDQALRATGGTWVAWGSSSEDRSTVDERDCVAVPPAKPAYTLKRVWLTDDEVDNYDEAFKYYFDVILKPFSKFMLKAIEKVDPLELDMICPGHGPILRSGWKEKVELSKHSLL